MPTRVLHQNPLEWRLAQRVFTLSRSITITTARSVHECARRLRVVWLVGKSHAPFPQTHIRDRPSTKPSRTTSSILALFGFSLMLVERTLFVEFLRAVSIAFGLWVNVPRCCDVVLDATFYDIVHRCFLALGYAL